MKISVKSVQPETAQKSCVIVGVYDNGTLSQAAKAMDKASKQAITKLIKQGTFTGKKDSFLPLFSLAGTKVDQILLVGLGKPGSITPAGFKRVITKTIKALTALNTKHATCFLTDVDVAKKDLAWKVKQVAEAAADASYQFTIFKSGKETPAHLQTFVINNPEKKLQKACDTALLQADAIAAGMDLTKNLANTPSNICTPSFLAAQAREMAKDFRALSVKILEEKEMQKLGMGALLAVSQGSAEDAKLICMEYNGGSKKQRPVVLVGKGITFDTGGNSLKPADSMVGMKYDMCGAASVMGTIQAIAQMRLPINVVGIIPAVENMPGGSAYKPEDILTSMSGQTIEVISTDAEGRLVLCDALTYAERYKPEVVIDIATLTGAVVIALGFHATGLISNDDKLAQDLLKAGTESNDRAWQLPLWDEYQEQIKSPFADMANTGGRAAGTITAACFLSRFTEKFAWAHLDVAGTAAMMMGTAERMATGRPVPMLVQYLIDRVQAS